MKRGLNLLIGLIGLNLLLASYGCIAEYRDENRWHHDEYRERGEHKGDIDRDYDERRDRYEHRDRDKRDRDERRDDERR